jgi:hypothetical protein
MIDLSTLLPRVSPFVVDCPDGIQHDAIRRAASQFVRDSGCWVESVSTPSILDQADYDFNALHEHENVFIKRITSVSVGGGEIPDNLGQWSVRNGVLTLASVPAEADTAVKAELVLVGTRVCTEVADDVFDRYGDGIADLALFFIRRTKHRPYFDREGANTAYASYRVILNEARRDCETGGQQSGDTITPMPDYF